MLVAILAPDPGLQSILDLLWRKQKYQSNYWAAVNRVSKIMCPLNQYIGQMVRQCIAIWGINTRMAETSRETQRIFWIKSSTVLTKYLWYTK